MWYSRACNIEILFYPNPYPIYSEGGEMKKTFVFLSMLIILAFLSACGQQSPKKSYTGCYPVDAQVFDDPKVTNGDLTCDFPYPTYTGGYVATITKADGTEGIQMWHWGIGEGVKCVTVNKLTVKINLEAPAGYGWKHDGDEYCIVKWKKF